MLSRERGVDVGAALEEAAVQWSGNWQDASRVAVPRWAVPRQRWAAGGDEGNGLQRLCAINSLAGIFWAGFGLPVVLVGTIGHHHKKNRQVVSTSIDKYRQRSVI